MNAEVQHTCKGVPNVAHRQLVRVGGPLYHKGSDWVTVINYQVDVINGKGRGSIYYLHIS